jgi:hypothetical protein
MVLHFALITLVLLAFVVRLNSFEATLELAENVEFAGQLENIQQVPWHRCGLSASRFANLGFQIRYHADIKKDKTVNELLQPRLAACSNRWR